MPSNQPARQRFEALFRDHHPAVQRYARRRVIASAVDDVVAETFLVAWRRLDGVPEQPLPWLLGVARNVIGTEQRGQSRRERLFEKARSDFSGTAPEPLIPGFDDGPVMAALEALSERDREALTLVAWDGLTPAEAAAVLGETPNRFRVRLHRAGRRLRWQLDRTPHTPLTNGATL